MPIRTNALNIITDDVRLRDGGGCNDYALTQCDYYYYYHYHYYHCII